MAGAKGADGFYHICGAVELAPALAPLPPDGALEFALPPVPRRAPRAPRAPRALASMSAASLDSDGGGMAALAHDIGEAALP